MALHTCNPSTLEVDARGYKVHGHLQLLSKFEISLRYTRHRLHLFS